MAIGREGRKASVKYLGREICVGRGDGWDGKMEGKESRRLPGSWLSQVTFSGPLVLYV